MPTAGTNSLSSQQKRLEHAGQLHWFHWLIVSCSLVLTFGAWYFTNKQVEEKVHGQFTRQAEQAVELISERMHRYEDALWSGVAAIKSQSYKMDHSEWKNFSDALRIEQRYPGINGIGIIFNIQSNNVDSYLQQQRESRPDFSIHPQHTQNEYFPITYIEPVEKNRKAVGLDMAHETNRYNAAKKARDTNSSQITGPIVLVQDSEKTPGFLFYVPFYKGFTQQHIAIQDRQKNFVGLVYAPFIFKNLLQGTLDEEKRSVSLKIQDGTDILYNENKTSNPDYDPNPLFSQNITVDMYGRDWEFSISTTNSFRKQNANNQPKIILLGGIFIDTLLLTLFLLLAKGNRNAIKFSEKMVENYQERTLDLEQANAELEEFSYRTSHDLRSPITSAIGLLEFASQAMTNNKQEKALTSINHATTSLNILKKLIDDLLELTKVKNIEEENEDIDVATLIDESIERLMNMQDIERITFHKDLTFNELIHTKKIRLTMIIENLISNAIKYHDPQNSHPYIKVITTKTDNDFVLEVEDNGLGIPEAYRDQLFTMFKRFHPKIAFGSGLGLYMIKKSANVLKGSIGYRSNGVGSTFHLKIPL